jgi:hypothetical protein
MALSRYVVKKICFQIHSRGFTLRKTSQAEAKLCRDAYLHAFICHPDRSARRSFAVKRCRAKRLGRRKSLPCSPPSDVRFNVSRESQYCQVALAVIGYNYMIGYWLRNYIFSEFRASSVFFVTVVSVTTYIFDRCGGPPWTQRGLGHGSSRTIINPR